MLILGDKWHKRKTAGIWDYWIEVCVCLPSWRSRMCSWVPLCGTAPAPLRCSGWGYADVRSPHSEPHTSSCCCSHLSQTTNWTPPPVTGERGKKFNYVKKWRKGSKIYKRNTPIVNLWFECLSTCTVGYCNVLVLVSSKTLNWHCTVVCNIMSIIRNCASDI